MSEYIPDPMELAEAAAERAYDELSLPSGRLKCWRCDQPFDPESDGGTITPDPYAMPVCGICFDEEFPVSVSNSLDSMEGIETEELERNPDGTLHQYLVKEAGQSFRCGCGCNVFHKRVGEPETYICNSCDIEYHGA